MIPSNCAWRPPLSMRSSKESSRFFSVRAVAPPEPYRQEKLRARALHDENGRGGPMLPPGCCSRFVWPTRSTSLLARAPIVVCSRGSQQKYCVALSEKSWCGSSVCDEYMLFLLAKWLGIHLTRVHGPSSDQSALLEASISRFRLQWLCTS